MSVFCHHSPLRLGMAEGQAFPLVLNQLYIHSWLSSCCQIAFNSTLPSASCPAVTPKHREAPTNPKLAHEIPPEILPQQYPQPNIHFDLLRTEIPPPLGWPVLTCSILWEKVFALLSCPNLPNHNSWPVPLVLLLASTKKNLTPYLWNCPCSSGRLLLNPLLTPHVNLKRLIWGPKHIAPGVPSPALSRGTKCLPWPASCALSPGLFQVLFYRPLIQSVPSLLWCMGLFHPRNSMLSFMRLILTQQTHFSRSLSNEGPLFGLASTAPFP